LHINELGLHPFLDHIFHHHIKAIAGLGLKGLAEGLLMSNALLPLEVQESSLSRGRCMDRGRSLVLEMEALFLGMSLV
jgi:hypothetical protein